MDKRILIIDDGVYTPGTLKDDFSFERHDATALYYPRIIFSSVMHLRPDLISNDYLPNGLNSGEICAQVKPLPLISKLPVMTVSAHPKASKSVGRYGCDAFMASPFNFYELIDCISEQLLYAEKI